MKALLIGLALAAIAVVAMTDALAQSRTITGGTQAGLTGGYCPTGTCNRLGGRWSPHPLARCTAAHCWR